MKRRLTLSKLLIVMGVCLSSSVYGNSLYLTNQNELVPPNAPLYNTITILSNMGQGSFLTLDGGNSLNVKTISIYVGAVQGSDYWGGFKSELIIRDGNFTAEEMTLTGAGAKGNDAYLSLLGGTSTIGSITSYGSSYVSLTGGHATFGTVNLGAGSHFQAGYSGPENLGTTSTMTLNGTITTDTFTIGANLTSISLGNNLLSQSANGDITVFKYTLVSPNEDVGSSTEVLDTIIYAETLLKQAIEEYKSSGDKLYDLTEAEVVVKYGTEAMNGPGTITITGVKPIPEPSSATLGLLGLSALLLRRKRRA